MCSSKMRAANRRNAKLSTGPKTAEGKARSSQNALTHGLSARATVVLDESVEEFDAFARGVRDDLRPCGPMEAMLVDRIVHISWKLRRIPRLEGELLVDPDPLVSFDLDQQQTDRVAYVMKMDLRMNESPLRKIQEYELRLDRTLHATLRELKRLRAMKREARDDAPEERSMQAEACPPAQVVQDVDVAHPENEPVLTLAALNPPGRSGLAPTVAGPRRARAS